MIELSDIDYLILDKMLDDMESVECIVTMLNHPEVGNVADNGGKLFRTEEVEASLRRLSAAGLVKRMYWQQPRGPWQVFSSPSENIADDWFDLTDEGRSVSLKWQARNV